MKENSYYRANEDLTYTPTTHAEERALFVRAKTGDMEAKERIIKSHLLFVANLARKLVKGRLPDDAVVSAANFALMVAFDRFNPDFPNRFSAYLKLHVRGEVARLFSSLNIVSKSDFSDGVPVVSVPVEEDSSEDNTAEEADHRTFLLKLLAESKGVLDERESQIVTLLFSEAPSSQSDVARKLGLSRERVRQIFGVALEKLRREMRVRMNSNNINQ